MSVTLKGHQLNALNVGASQLANSSHNNMHASSAIYQDQTTVLVCPLGVKLRR